MKTLPILLISLYFIFSNCFPQNFIARQKRYERVRTAIAEKDSLLQSRFTSKALEYPPNKILLRCFKQEKIVELWSFSSAEKKFVRVYMFPICASSGKLGPKRQQGDLQVPEGFYHIDRFNPVSQFYLSLGINYPNASDRILGVKGHLGGDIFIHGDCVTIGCIPITNALIKEVYWAAVQAKANGQRNIPVHIFPTRLDETNFTALKLKHPDKPELLVFWKNLKQGFDYFERHHTLPIVRVDKQGTYLFD
ncbi:hypothetical protein JXJ21_22125 [candidate division KSB1 bacterium]|nr:hypothetical protein [candidate division KSB1 bacterium]